MPDAAPFDASYDAPAGEPKQTATITANVVSTRFITREHFLASAEMQITGEPEEVAEFLSAITQSELRAHIRETSENALTTLPDVRSFEIRHG